MKLDTKRLFVMLIVRCNYALETKLQNRSNIRALKDGGSFLKIIDAIKKERYLLLRSG